MILRHVTRNTALPSIIKSDCLDPEFLQREHDRGHISFELNPKTELLTKYFHVIKGWNQDEPFELLFDGEELLQDNYEILHSIEGIKFNKEVDIGWKLRDAKIPYLKEDVDNIEYCFIKGKVQLKYLTEESKRKLSEWADKNI
ncbi:hypothetical protein [Neobacillus ginsengisoli]|uniref:Uncharacterized protein n=1 Tax=Neobacillus ginsengisoli TaxID=904295 RepID=A0ABT9XNF1_9BACI|nr:hypothetical protein [Neobacillus ginsengisoli]MDQ0197076.1 hypothetical protein [Neobacillus ginsengisoli]